MRVQIIIGALLLILVNENLKADISHKYLDGLTFNNNYKSYIPDEFLTQSKIDTTNRQELLNKVKNQGQIKIWVYHDMEFIPEKNLNSEEVLKQRAEIQKRHTELVSELGSKIFFSKADYKFKKRPVLSFVVDEEALKFLLKSEKIKKITAVERATTKNKCCKSQ